MVRNISSFRWHRSIYILTMALFCAFYGVLRHLDSLALGSFTVAFFARNLSDTFIESNESKFLLHADVLQCVGDLLPIYHSTKGKITVAVEVILHNPSNVGLLVGIFFPKWHIILQTSGKNSLHKFKLKHIHES